MRRPYLLSIVAFFLKVSLFFSESAVFAAASEMQRQVSAVFEQLQRNAQSDEAFSRDALERILKNHKIDLSLCNTDANNLFHYAYRDLRKSKGEKKMFQDIVLSVLSQGFAASAPASENPVKLALETLSSRMQGLQVSEESLKLAMDEAKIPVFIRDKDGRGLYYHLYLEILKNPQDNNLREIFNHLASAGVGMDVYKIHKAQPVDNYEWNDSDSDADSDYGDDADYDEVHDYDDYGYVGILDIFTLQGLLSDYCHGLFHLVETDENTGAKIRHYHYDRNIEKRRAVLTAINTLPLEFINATKNSATGETALHIAVLNTYDQEILEALLSRGVDLKARTLINESALDVAVRVRNSNAESFIAAQMEKITNADPCDAKEDTRENCGSGKVKIIDIDNTFNITNENLNYKTIVIRDLLAGVTGRLNLWDREKFKKHTLRSLKNHEPSFLDINLDEIVRLLIETLPKHQRQTNGVAKIFRSLTNATEGMKIPGEGIEAAFAAVLKDPRLRPAKDVELADRPRYQEGLKHPGLLKLEIEENSARSLKKKIVGF